MGQLSLYMAEQDASRVLATDASERMLGVARSERPHPRIEYHTRAMEDLHHRRADLVVGSLAMHYVADYASLVRSVASWPRSGGWFVFSVEHPMKTAPKGPGVDWVEDEEGRSHWPVDGYCEEGKRAWLAGSIVKHHRQVATLVNAPVNAGLVVRRLEEPEEALEARRREAIFPLHRQSVLVIQSVIR